MSWGSLEERKKTFLEDCCGGGGGMGGGGDAGGPTMTVGADGFQSAAPAHVHLPRRVEQHAGAAASRYR